MLEWAWRFTSNIPFDEVNAQKRKRKVKSPVPQPLEYLKRYLPFRNREVEEVRCMDVKESCDMIFVAIAWSETDALPRYS